jgi:hypothetical protein
MAVNTTDLQVAGVASFAIIPTSPTALPGDNSTKLATTAFVTTAVGNVNISDAVTQPKGDNSTKIATTAFVSNALSGVSTTKYRFVAADGQTVFDTGAVLVDPMVYLNGVLQTKDSTYTFTTGGTSITFLDARVLNETVVIM